jgi:high-affinity nickel-transport protein
VDADHIAAIDNVTRKLMQDGKRPLAVGFFFSLGHSTIVILASVAIALMASAFKSHLDTLRGIGGVVGTLISATFLFSIAVMNIFISAAIYRTFRLVKKGGLYVEEDLDLLLAKGGPLTQIFRPMFRVITHSWQMYPMGFLFGLGFDTATEIGLLGISAASASQGLSICSILVFPALFTAGMLLIDTTDSILMLGAYSWALINPIRKLYYNMTITSVSVLVALIVGGLETLNLIGDEFQFKGAFWDTIGSINNNFGILGYVIIGIVVGAWAISFLIYRAKKYDQLEISSAN